MRLIALLLPVLLLAACAGGTGGGSDEAAGTAFQGSVEERLNDRAQFGRILIATVNLGKPSRNYLVEHETRVDELVAQRLVEAGYEVLPAGLFDEAWREGLRKWGEPYDPTTGKLNETAFKYVLNEAMNYLVENSTAQAVMFTNLEEMQVYFSPSGSHNAHFLGVTRKPSSRGGEGVPAGFNWIQGVDAVGLYINVFDMQLQRLFSGAGGIEVTETLNLKNAPRWVRSKKILDNDGYLEEGIDLALRPWLPAS